MCKRFCLSLLGILFFFYSQTSLAKTNAYSPQLVHVNHDFTIQIPRDWSRRSNTPAQGMAALFAPNMDITTPNVSIFILRANESDADEVTRDLVHKTPGGVLNHVFKKSFGDIEAVISDVSSKTQETTTQSHVLWSTKRTKAHVQRSFHVVINDKENLLIITCTAVTEAHIRDCRLIIASFKQVSVKR